MHSEYEQVLKKFWPECKKGKNKAKFPKNHLVVGCGEEFHRIYLTPCGAVSFKDHDIKEVQAAVTMDKLAHTKLSDSSLYECAVVLRCLQDIPHQQAINSIWNYDERIGAVISYIHGVLSGIGNSRKAIKQASNLTEEDTSSLESILKQALKDVKYSVVPNLKYRGVTNPRGYNYNTEYPVQGGIQYIVKVEKNPMTIVHAEGSLYKEQKPKGSRHRPDTWAKFEATLNLMWYMRVFKKGIAVLDGMLVLDYVKTFPNHQLLLKIARQGYGFTINEVFAVYDPDRAHISWITDEEKLSLICDGDKIPRRRRTKKEMQDNPVI
jgi:hypothetical protein